MWFVIQANLVGIVQHHSTHMPRSMFLSCLLNMDTLYTGIVFQGFPLSQQFSENKCSIGSIEGSVFLVSSAMMCVCVRLINGQSIIVGCRPGKFRCLASPKTYKHTTSTEICLINILLQSPHLLRWWFEGS